MWRRVLAGVIYSVGIILAYLYTPDYDFLNIWREAIAAAQPGGTQIFDGKTLRDMALLVMGYMAGAAGLVLVIVYSLNIIDPRPKRPIASREIGILLVGCTLVLFPLAFLLIRANMAHPALTGFASAAILGVLIHTVFISCTIAVLLSFGLAGIDIFEPRPHDARHMLDTTMIALCILIASVVGLPSLIAEIDFTLWHGLAFASLLVLIVVLLRAYRHHAVYTA